MRRADVLVLGGGAAGLAAARALTQQGRTVVLVEARPRLGGRILTLHDAAWPMPVELGAEFLHGEAEAARRAAGAAGAAVVELPDTHVWAENGRLRPADDTWPQVGRLLGSARRLRRDVPFAEWLAGRRAPEEVRRMARLFVEGYSAAHADRVSARWLAEGAEETQEQRQYRPEPGYQSLVDWMRSGLDPERTDVRLSTIAERVEWARGSVRVVLRSATGRALAPVEGRALVITLPIGVLKARPGMPGALEFDPPVPALAPTLARLLAGPVRKVVLRFREAFWDEPGFLESRLPRRRRALARSVTFLHDPTGAFPTWWLAAPRRVPVLTAWAAGPAADALTSLDERAVAERALASLSRMLRMPRGRVEEGFEAWAMHDWQRDPFSRSAYAYVGVGGLGAPERLARPVQGTLFFAGEATGAEEMGTVAGAISSGLAAAAKIARR